MIVNKNTVPGETRSPFVTSGIRIGTPCVTTRGFGEGIVRVLDAPDDEAVLGEVADDIVRLCEEYPVYR